MLESLVSLEIVYPFLFCLVVLETEISIYCYCSKYFSNIQTGFLHMLNRLFVYCYKLDILIHSSLSVADLALVVVMVVDKCIAYHYMTYNTVEPLWFRLSYPYFWHPIKGIFLCATIYMVVAVSAERFRAICYPFSERHVSNLAILTLKNDITR